MFFSHEHEPIHVHVVGKGVDAKYVWNGKNFVLLKNMASMQVISLEEAE